jgi:hypothetical protein
MKSVGVAFFVNLQHRDSATYDGRDALKELVSDGAISAQNIAARMAARIT